MRPSRISCAQYAGTFPGISLPGAPDARLLELLSEIGHREYESRAPEEFLHVKYNGPSPAAWTSVLSTTCRDQFHPAMPELQRNTESEKKQAESRRGQSTEHQIRLTVRRTRASLDTNNLSPFSCPMINDSLTLATVALLLKWSPGLWMQNVPTECTCVHTITCLSLFPKGFLDSTPTAMSWEKQKAPALK